MKNMTKQRSVALHTLGCKLNFSETSTLTRLLEQEGFEKKAFDDVADVYVINTCSVTDNADKECRQIVRRIQRNAPDSFIVITGCYAQLKPNEIAAIPGVDLVLGAAEKFNIVQHLQQLTKTTGNATICSCDIDDVTGFNSAFSINDRTRTFLKVQDGCDYNCSFCTIPMARGISRSDTITSVLANAETIAQNGIKEIVLTGVNLGDFGKGPDGKKRKENFFQLIQALDEIQGIERFRISSIEPNLLTNEIIQFVASSNKFMPHFHIPLQSGSNAILGLMRRRYQRELYQEKVATIKAQIPHCAIGVDVIVGFPGETDTHFKETHDFLHQLDISYLHVFTYSERPNTLAVNLPGAIPISIRNERNKILRNLSFKKLQYFTAQHTGTTRKVLFEDANKNGMMEGYTDNYIRIQTPYRKEWANNIIDWTI
ncbi:tRNA (N(6)-L-threonylcarbamoyladenosine(37)-C(2))-methylthiotransferase MtaB [Hydrotalea sandarakina]|uniref:Threonylcarbamoyladenosine tRNA methylthiotransferase MtaB n=1 Tax=Hydrotalea sandarakina TaxID=1004304 RepID=A0A2W7RZ12_9BACT|nr:tRNA (N(6)-L-threonylcarbamoyladenosine(37)-C(2))-methylthiotransferase MtaB [Hydrotalea sandarakina]PZX65761.1 threonylcarbamoyladenosine tRNA methylthiotransferase MtaB [Hydrotalea sandarakina]